MSAEQDSASQRLGDDTVEEIGRIIETLERSPFDFIELEFGGMKLTMGRGDFPVAAPTAPAPAPLAAEVSAVDTVAEPVAVTAPLLGRFQARPEPGAPPFVTVGSPVQDDTTVGVITVMTTPSPVRAGVSGIVTETCVEDGGFVEYGQVLLRVRPAHG